MLTCTGISLRTEIQRISARHIVQCHASAPRLDTERNQLACRSHDKAARLKCPYKAVDLRPWTDFLCSTGQQYISSPQMDDKNPTRATATCYCGTVQLELYVIPVSFVGWRHGRVQRLTLRFSFSKQPVDGPDLIDTFICKLRRLPRDHRLNVCLKLHRRRQGTDSRPWSRQTEILRSVGDDRNRKHHDELFLRHLWHLDVPCIQRVSWSVSLAHWDSGRFQLA